MAGTGELYKYGWSIISKRKRKGFTYNKIQNIYKAYDLYNILIIIISYSWKLTPTWAEGGVGTGEHPPKDVRFEDDNVPPIPLWPNF